MRPWAAWSLFVVGMAVPVLCLITLARHAAVVEQINTRAGQTEALVVTAQRLRGVADRTLRRGEEALRTIPYDAPWEVGVAKVDEARLWFADVFVVASDGKLLVPPPESAVREGVESWYLDPTTQEAGWLRTERPVDRPDQVTIVSEPTRLYLVRKLGNGVRIGVLIHAPPLLRDAQRILLPDQVLVPTDDVTAASFFGTGVRATSWVPTTFPGPDSPGFALRLPWLPPASITSGTAHLALAPKLVFHVAAKDPEAAARNVERHGRRVLGYAGAAIVFIVMLATALFVRGRRAQRLADLRTDFVAAVSHELRTPLASVRMFAELLEQGAVPLDERAEVERTLAGEARRLHGTLERMLRFGALARGKLVADKRLEPIGPIVDQAVMRLHTSRPGHEVRVDVEPSLTANVDSGLVGLALDNLLANAAKYASEWGPFAIRARGEGKDVVLDVVDGGLGLDKRTLRRVFQPFERADSRLSKATEGTGVGLALVRGIARAHGGEASATSKPGAGCTFTLRLPRA